MATTDEARAARDAKLDALHERLTSAVETLVSGDDWQRALEFAARFRARSFNNTLLIWAQHLDAFEEGTVAEPVPSHVAGFKQWQSLGRQVSKGQSGYMIFAPVKGRFASTSPADPASWRRLGKSEGPKPGEVVRSRLVGVRPTYVWDLSQTTGDPVPEAPHPRLLEGEAPAGLWDGLARLVEAEGFSLQRVPHESVISGANGVTDYQTRTVSVRENMDPAAQVKTLAHELAHATWLADSGVPLHVLQQILGHQSIETTKAYLHPDHRHLADAAKQANKFLAKTPRRREVAHRDAPTR